MGVTDYGVNGAKSYRYSTTEFVSWSNFTSLSISGGKSISLQQNVVDYGVAVSKQGEYWIQNVPFVTASGSSYMITFENNIWNFSAIFTSFTGTMKSTDVKGNLLGDCSASGVYGHNEYYACQAKNTVTVSGAFSIETVTSTSKITSGADRGDASVTFAAYVYQGSTMVGGGAYDKVAFVSKASSKPSFKVGGTDPGGFYNDAEIVLCGPGGGSSATISSISAKFSEFHLSKGSLVSIPHAWSAGSDTAETVFGVRMTGSGMEGVASSGADNQVQLW
jgi:Thermopsin